MDTLPSEMEAAHMVEVMIKTEPGSPPVPASSPSCDEMTSMQTYECSVCGDEFKSQMALKIHSTKIHSVARVNEERAKLVGVGVVVGGIKALACGVCGRVLQTRKRLREHVTAAHPPASAAVKCTVCNKVFKNRTSLKVHARMVHVDQRVSCPLCNKVFKTPMLLQKHTEWSHSTDGRTFPCPLCPRVLNSQSGYNKHIENVHPPAEAAVRCTEAGCDKLFKSPYHQRQHHKRYHLGIRKPPPPAHCERPSPQHQCPLCPKTFTTTGALDFHRERDHPDGAPSGACGLCPRVLPDRASLARHVRGVHAAEAGELGGACQLCGKEFKSRLSLSQHSRVTHAPPDAAVDCPYCGKTLKCKPHLQVHISTVHRTRPSEHAECAVCGKTFTCRKYMERHARSHGDKTHACTHEECDKLFKSIEDVKRHEKRVHAAPADAKEAARWSCDVCDKELCTVYKLRAHVQGVHGTTAVECTCGCRRGFTSAASLDRHRQRVYPSDHNQLDYGDAVASFTQHLAQFAASMSAMVATETQACEMGVEGQLTTAIKSEPDDEPSQPHSF